MWHNSYAICELSGFLTNKSVISNIKCHFCFFVYKYLHKFAIEVSENLGSTHRKTSSCYVDGRVIRYIVKNLIWYKQIKK